MPLGMTEGLSVPLSIYSSCKIIVLQSPTRYAGAPFAQGAFLYSFIQRGIPQGFASRTPHKGVFLCLRSATYPGSSLCDLLHKGRAPRQRPLLREE